MANAIPKLDKPLTERAIEGADAPVIRYLNREIGPTLRLIYNRLNSLLAQLLDGAVKVGSVTVTVGTGVPAIAATNGDLFIRTDGGAGSTLYVYEGGAWQAK